MRKKIFYLTAISVLGLSLAFTGCGKKKNSVSAENTTLSDEEVESLRAELVTEPETMPVTIIDENGNKQEVVAEVITDADGKNYIKTEDSSGNIVVIEKDKITEGAVSVTEKESEDIAQGIIEDFTKAEEERIEQELKDKIDEIVEASKPDETKPAETTKPTETVKPTEKPSETTKPTETVKPTESSSEATKPTDTETEAPTEEKETETQIEYADFVYPVVNVKSKYITFDGKRYIVPDSKVCNPDNIIEIVADVNNIGYLFRLKSGSNFSTGWATVSSGSAWDAPSKFEYKPGFIIQASAWYTHFTYYDYTGSANEFFDKVYESVTSDKLLHTNCSVTGKYNEREAGFIFSTHTRKEEKRGEYNVGMLEDKYDITLDILQFSKYNTQYTGNNWSISVPINKFLDMTYNGKDIISYMYLLFNTREELNNAPAFNEVCGKWGVNSYDTQLFLDNISKL